VICWNGLGDGGTSPVRMSILNRGSFRNLALAILCLSWIHLIAPAHADEYQDAIAKAFPGFRIMSRTEFTKEIRKAVKGNPGLITGRFNDDELMDFAAIIRDDSKQRTHLGAEYYRGMFVVCHAMDKQRYACQMLGQRAIDLPFFLYLYRVEPGKLSAVTQIAGSSRQLSSVMQSGLRRLIEAASAWKSINQMART